MRTPTLAASLIAAFLLGATCARLVPVAAAADAAAPAARIIDIGRMSDEEIGAARPGGTLRTQTLVAAPGATVSIQSGDTPKHYHQGSDEIQYILEGSGSFWLGDTKREIGPGDLIVIPKGVNHGGTVATSGRFKALSIKTPPQAADDVHVVP